MNNRDKFLNWWKWSLKFKDVDPAVWMTKYLHKRYESNREQRIWFAWLFANTYQLPTAWVLFNEFPDFELCSYERIKEWNAKNYDRLRYQTDTKWNKGHLPEMFRSYRDFIGNHSQEERFLKFGGCFNSAWDSLKSNLHKFGRYSTWFYMQHLHETAGLSFHPTSMMFSDVSGSSSHRAGFLFSLDLPENYSDYASLELEAKNMLKEVGHEEANFFNMESCLCSFKKIFRDHHGRYLGYYLDRQSEEIQRAEKDRWDGIDWDVLWQARDETLDKRLTGKKCVDKSKMFNLLKNGGTIPRLEWLDGKMEEECGLSFLF